jgi:hypothetical protein
VEFSTQNIFYNDGMGLTFFEMNLLGGIASERAMNFGPRPPDEPGKSRMVALAQRDQQNSKQQSTKSRSACSFHFVY